MALVLVDWSWLTYTNRADYHPPIEVRKQVPSHSPLAQRPFWDIIDTSQLGAFGLAVHDERLLHVCRDHPKRSLYLQDLLEKTDIDSFVPNEYEFCAVVRTGRGPISDRPFVLRQKAPLTERDMDLLFR